jgi:hypothetical protein
MVVKTRESAKLARVQGAVQNQSTRKNPAPKLPETGFMLGDNGEPVTPPWLIDAKTKTPKARKPKLPPKTRSTAKKTATRKPRTSAVTKSMVTPVPVVVMDGPVIAQNTSVPLTRNQAPVVWQKNGPVGAIGYWFRTTGRSVMAKLGSGPKRPRTQASIGATLRTKNDLLREISVLRKENAAMRDRLGLPPKSLGHYLK